MALRAGAGGRAYRDLAASWGAAFLDAGAVARAHQANGVHLDGEAHRAIGQALVQNVRGLVPGG